LVIASLLHPSGYLGIFVFLVLTGCGLPIPEEVAIVIAGVLSAEGHLRAEFALVTCVAGSVVGDCLLYAIGNRWGGSLLTLHPALARLLHAEREKRFEMAIERHSFKVMLLARFMVGIRTPVYLATGAVGMTFRRFLLTDLFCATLVVSLVFGISYAFGPDVARLIRRAEWTVTLVVVLVVVIAGGLLYYRHREYIMRTIFGIRPPTE
jgi:membrane protein DedA with SNARE-associated domain